MSGTGRLQTALGRDRLLATGGLLAVLVLAWGDLLRLAGGMAAPAAGDAA